MWEGTKKDYFDVYGVIKGKAFWIRDTMRSIAPARVQYISCLAMLDMTGCFFCLLFHRFIGFASEYCFARP
jgi:hypothetical protein